MSTVEEETGILSYIFDVAGIHIYIVFKVLTAVNIKNTWGG
jgi:hypothetical protein